MNKQIKFTDSEYINIEKEILNLRKKLEENQVKAAKIEGQIEQETQRVQNNFGISSIEEIEKRINELREEILTSEKKLKSEHAKFKEKFGDNL
ncbi:MAG: hypothetical protein ACTSYH_03660 [Candidatus Heimdallarchaeaceae archaeon]